MQLFADHKGNQVAINVDAILLAEPIRHPNDTQFGRWLTYVVLAPDVKRWLDIPFDTFLERIKK